MSLARYIIRKTPLLTVYLLLFVHTLPVCSDRYVMPADFGSIYETDQKHDHPGEQMVANTSALLDQLLLGYDRRLRPGFGGPPTTVDVNLNIRSMGPISEREMAYQLDCYFRQSWVDRRLEFTGPLKTLVVGVNILERMWKPDTHFFNGQRSYLHTVTTPNKLIRIRQDGRILYSMRITIKASCPMHLEKFPMDTQTCPLRFGSHGYDERDLIFVWTYGANKSIKMATDMRLSQFDLIGFPAGSDFINNSKRMNTMFSGKFSVLYADFILRRHMGYFMINVYVPSVLLVILSWVAFFINREATADRIALGIMTVLTMAFLGIDNRRDLPKVSYSTALDYFVAISFVFVLATVIQFAGVHYFTKHGSGEEMPDSDEEDNASDTEDHNQQLAGYISTRYGTRPKHSSYVVTGRKSNGSAKVTLDYEPSSEPNQHHRPFHDDNCCKKFFYCIRGHARYRDMKTKSTPISVNSVSKIDKASRYLFPASYLAFNMFYWFYYMDDSEDAFYF